MARLGTVRAGSFAGGVTPAIWTEVTTVLIPQMSTYNSTTAGGTVRSSPNAGKWEGHIVTTVYPHLRIDLQGLTEPRDKSLITWNAGSHALHGDASPIRFANWQVQFGPHNATRATFSATRTMTATDLQAKKGSIAGIHMALASDFGIADLTQAFQDSYDGSVVNGNTFGVIQPDAAYVEPIIEVEKRWIAKLRCKRSCKALNQQPFRVNLGKKEGRFEGKPAVENFMSNALGRVECPKCHAMYSLEFVGDDSLTDQAVGGARNWKYNFQIDSYTLVEE